jgi:hypothetical protein
MTRFSAPLKPIETCRCARCEDLYHYTLLDDRGFCPDCRAQDIEREEFELDKQEIK